MASATSTDRVFPAGRLVEALPWHAGAFAALMSVALGLIASVGDGAFTVVVASLMTLSLTIGYLLGVLIRPGLWRTLVMAIACTAMSIVAYQFAPIRGILLNPDIIGDEDLVLCAYMQAAVITLGPASASRAAMLFCFVFSLSIMGLVGQTNLNVEAIASFMGFVLFALFFLGYDNLRRRGTVSQNGIASAPGRLVADQLYASALVFVVLGGSGFLLGTIMTLVIRSPFGLPPLRLSAAMEDAGFSATPFTSFQNTLSLGGGPIPDQSTPVMRVQADRELLYRSRVYGFYDGGVWSVATGAGMFMGPNSAGTVREEPRGEEGEEIVEYTIYPEVGMAVSVPSPAVPELLDAGPVLIEIDPMGCARPEAALGPSVAIEGRSRINTRDPELLRRSGMQVDPLARIYASEPESPRIVGLARQITAGQQTTYDRVMALQSFIENECAYNTAAARYDQRRDPVEQFLFERKEGVCAEFASALALLARSVGIPARVASGYSSGKWDAAAGVYRVSVAHAHAWTEVHFPGVGWVPFDPQATRVVERRPLADVLGAVGRALSDLGRWVKRQILMLLFVGPLGFIVLYSSRSLREFLSRKRRRRGQGTRSDVGRLYLDLCDAVSRLGPARGPADAPGEFLERLAEALAGREPSLVSEASELSDTLIGLRYGPREPAAEEVAVLRTRVRALARRALSA